MRTKFSKHIVLFALTLLCSFSASAQDRTKALQVQLDSLALFIPGLNERSELALSDVPLSDYVRSLGKVHRINLYIDNTPNEIVTTRLSNEPVKSILLFLCKKFDLSIEPSGTILNMVPWVAPVEVAPAPKAKIIEIDYKGGMISFDLKKDSLSTVVRKISRLSGERIFIKSGTAGTLNGYVPPTEFDLALESLMYMNGFSVKKHNKGFWTIESASGNGNNAGDFRNPMDYSLEVLKDSLGELIFLKAENISKNDILRDLFHSLDIEYFIFDELAGKTTMNVEGLPLDEVLKNLLRGTDFTWKNEDGVYLMGLSDMDGLRQVKVVNLNYRPTAKVIELMPSKLKEGVELKEFVELNKIILSGSAGRIREISEFIKEIDKPVPMVKIEMMVVDVNFSRIMRSGFKAGLARKGDSLGVTKALFPGLDYNLNGSEINNVLQGSGVPALMGIGALKSNFYLSIQAQELQGNLKVITRPILTTLNGNEANIMVGETRYYLLETNTASNGAVNSYNQISQRFEKIEINTTVSVTPYVSQDGIITLEVAPNFTEPGAQISPELPPDVTTRQFNSIIRVKDGETVVLGGLSRESTSQTSDGLPFLSRIPVLRWFFGNTSKNKSKSSLIVYITPTIYYN